MTTPRRNRYTVRSVKARVLVTCAFAMNLSNPLIDFGDRFQIMGTSDNFRPRIALKRCMVATLRACRSGAPIDATCSNLRFTPKRLGRLGKRKINARNAPVPCAPCNFHTRRVDDDAPGSPFIPWHLTTITRPDKSAPPSVGLRTNRLPIARSYLFSGKK